MKAIKKISFVILFIMVLSVFSFNFIINAADEVKANPSGAYLKYTVNVNRKDGDRLAYNFTILKKLDYVIQEGDLLEYDVMITTEEAGWGAIDGDIEKVGVMRDSGISDTEDNNIHTGRDLSEYCYDQWWHRVIILGVTEEENGDKYTAGRKLNNIQIAMHPGDGEDVHQGVVYYDNIVITNNGEVKLVIFKDESDFDPAGVKFSHNKNCDKGSIEMLVFTDEEMQAMKDKEEAKIKEQESKEAAKAEAELLKQASIEQASIDAAIAAEKAAEEAANNTDAITEAAANGSKASDDGNGNNAGLIIGVSTACGAGVFVIIIAVASNKKKKAGK